MLHLAAGLLLFVILTPGLFAQTTDSAVLDHVRADYLKKAFLLRGFYQEPLLQYDSSGHLKHHASSGSWTTSYAFVEAVDIQDARLTLKAHRAVQIFDDHKHQFQLTRTDIKLLLTVEVPSPLEERGIREALGHIFIAPTEPIGGMLPDFWQPLLKNIDEKGKVSLDPKKDPWDPSVTGDCDQAPSVDRPCRIVKPMKPPKPVYTPDPDFGDLGKALHLRGASVLWLVIDETGQPQHIALMKPLGAGLDERAIDKVRSWKFQPVIRDGKPVPVMINVEFNFSWTS
jgi:hypothetical protein